MQIVGYGDRLSVEPGAGIKFMISSLVPRYQADVVRLIHGDANPLGPGFKSEPVQSQLSGEYDGREQKIRLGSYVRVPHDDLLDLQGSFTIQLWMRPTTRSTETQTLLGKDSYRLRLEEGQLALRIGADSVRLDKAVEAHTWYFVAAVYDVVAGEAWLWLEPLEVTAKQLGESKRASITGVPAAMSAADLLIASEIVDGVGVSCFFNGKIDSPRIFDRPLGESELRALRDGADAAEISGVVAAWDFSADVTTRTISDVSGNGLNGWTVNLPMRAATGHDWDGSELAWRRAPQQYGAIHFHDDDLDDAGWDVSLEWTVPGDLRSGVYALHLQSDGEEDFVPFVVRPRLGQPSAKILLLVPTFSYLAYGNEQLLASPETKAMLERMHQAPLGALARAYPIQPQDRYIVENRLLSLYDAHSDGSGVCYSSRLRPLLNMRPKYVMSELNLGEGSPHQLNADLHLVDWLHERGYEFDVITDEDLHLEGLELIESYRVVLTGTHPEYWSGQMLDAMEQYLAEGGRMMYLGGNGYYWVTQLDPEGLHTIEIRRLGPSTRTWEPAPGEGHLSTTGEPGGLWRHRGRAPQRWVGVGFTAQGAAPGRPYERQPASFEPRAAFIFEGIGHAELIGDFPSLVNTYGGAGYEIDRLDHSLSTPHRTLLLATATGFSDSYQHASEEVLVSDSAQGGTVNALVRADMVLVEYPNGGAVFSTGSIAWCGSLSYDGYDNTVSRITGNVLDRFASGGGLAP